MKRIVPLLCFLVLFLSFPLAAQAQSPLDTAIADSYQSGQEIDISAYGITKSQLDKTVHDLLNTGKLPWYADRYYSYTQEDTSDFVYSFTPQTLSSPEYDRDAYERTAAEILHEAVHEEMEPWQIALSLHDYLASHYSYDRSLYHHTGYDLLVNGSAVCTGYAYAYMDLMQRAGVPCVVVESPKMAQGSGHAWNLVQLNGNWYHVDVTWDDPSPDIYGRVSHQYFLLTDEEIYLNNPEGHYDWQTEIACTDPSFQGKFWKGVKSPILYTDKDTCYYRIDDNWDVKTIRRTEQYGLEEVIHTDKALALDLGGGPGHYEHDGLSLQNGRLYISQADGVYSILPDGTDLTEEYRFTPSKQYLFSSFLEGTTLHMTLSNGQFQMKNQDAALSGDPGHIHTYSPAQVTAPTCTEKGITKFVCSCGVSYWGSETPAVGHTYEKKILMEPSLSQEGQAQYTCSQCGDQYMESIPTVSIGQYVKDSPWIIIAGSGLILILFLIPLLLHKKRK